MYIYICRIPVRCIHQLVCPPCFSMEKAFVLGLSVDDVVDKTFRLFLGFTGFILAFPHHLVLCESDIFHK